MRRSLGCDMILPGTDLRNVLSWPKSGPIGDMYQLHKVSRMMPLIPASAALDVCQPKRKTPVSHYTRRSCWPLFAKHIWCCGE